MTEVALTLGAATLVVAVASAFAIRLLPTVKLQLAALALLAVALPLAAVLTSGWVMFHMHDDVKILSVSAASALSAIVGALLLARWIARPIAELRDASSRLAGGDLGSRAAELARPAELRELGRSFNEMAGNLERLFDARRQLVAWASHDLRTPVAAMQAMLEAIEDRLADPAEYVPALHGQVRALAALVDDLFELSRIDAGVLTLELRDARLGEIVCEAIRALEAQARARNVRLEATVGADVPDVRVAPEKVQRVLLNLLTNAIRHTPSDGAVAVVVERRLDQIVVAVEDSGDGLAPGAAERMFDRFWKDDVARPRGDGSGAGLGLAIARGLVEAHGGTIWAEPRPGGGARVAFALPANADPVN